MLPMLPDPGALTPDPNVARIPGEVGTSALRLISDYGIQQFPPLPRLGAPGPEAPKPAKNNQAGPVDLKEPDRSLFLHVFQSDSYEIYAQTGPFIGFLYIFQSELYEI